MIYTNTLTKNDYLKLVSNSSLEEIKNELIEITSLRDSYQINYNIFKGSIYHEVIRSALGFLSYPEKVLDEEKANAKFKDILERGFMYSVWALTEPYEFNNKESFRSANYTKKEALQVITKVFDDFKKNNYEEKILQVTNGIKAICNYAIWYYFDLKAYEDEELFKIYSKAPEVMFPNKYCDIGTKMKTIIANIVGVFDVNEK